MKLIINNVLYNWDDISFIEWSHTNRGEKYGVALFIVFRSSRAANYISLPHLGDFDTRGEAEIAGSEYVKSLI